MTTEEDVDAGLEDELMFWSRRCELAVVTSREGA